MKVQLEDARHKPVTVVETPDFEGVFPSAIVWRGRVFVKARGSIDEVPPYVEIDVLKI